MFPLWMTLNYVRLYPGTQEVAAVRQARRRPTGAAASAGAALLNILI
jgi:hypothetical protein